MKSEDVMKALECCARKKWSKCYQCPRNDEDALCMYRLCEDALTLLREKDAEIERLERICDSYALQYGTVVDKGAFLKQERADTVRKMREALEMRLQKIPQHHFTLSEVGWCIDNTEKELLEAK